MSAAQTIRIGAELFSRARSGVNASSLRSDIKRPFRLLFCGDPALVAEFRAALLASDAGFEPTEDAAAMLETIAPQRSETVAGDDVRLVVFLGRASDRGAKLDDLRLFNVPILALYVDDVGAPSSTGTPAAGQVETICVESLALDVLKARVFPFVVECCKGVAVAVGRRYPVLREAVCTALTRDAARSAMKIAAASAVVDQIPVLGFVVGTVASAGDIVAISALQMNLTLKIGTVYGREPDLANVWELLPVIGGGLGWRALSRELAGFVPVAGLAIKAAIGYAGTIVIGEGAAFYYRTGRHMSASQAGELYGETKRAAMDLAREMIARLRSRK